MKKISRKIFSISILLFLLVFFFIKQSGLENKAEKIEEKLSIVDSKLLDALLKIKYTEEDKKSQYYEKEEIRSQKYHTYERGWKTFQYHEKQGTYNFVGCIQFQYPEGYNLIQGEDRRYFSVADNLGNEVKFVWDYMGDYCANIGCYKYDAIKLPENVTQNYAVVKQLSRPKNTTTVGTREQYFAEVYLNDTGYRVVLGSINSSDFTKQLKILSTLSLGRYSCVDSGEREMISITGTISPFVER